MRIRWDSRVGKSTAIAAVFSLLLSACSSSTATGAPAGGASAPPPGPSTAAGGGTGSTAFTVSGGVSGQISVTSSDCRKGSGQDTPTQFAFTGTIAGVTYSVSIGGFALTSGTYDLKTVGGPGVSLQSNPNATGSDPRIFWAAPLRAADPDASGTLTATVSDSGGSGQVDAQLVQETLGVPTSGGSTVHLTGTWSCQFSS